MSEILDHHEGLAQLKQGYKMIALNSVFFTLSANVQKGKWNYGDTGTQL